MERYSILFHPDMVDFELPPLNKDRVSRIREAVKNRLETHPSDYGKPLRGELKNMWSLRVGDYRIIYKIHGQTVAILQITNRRDAYKAGILEARRRGIL